jgi:hypothetical protein
VPFNIASYALLTLMVAQVCDLEPGDFVHTFGDAHLYANHLEQADRQLAREPLPLPRMALNPEVRDIFGFRYEDFTLLGIAATPASRPPSRSRPVRVALIWAMTATASSAATTICPGGLPDGHEALHAHHPRASGDHGPAHLRVHGRPAAAAHQHRRHPPARLPFGRGARGGGDLDAALAAARRSATPRMASMRPSSSAAPSCTVGSRRRRPAVRHPGRRRARRRHALSGGRLVRLAARRSEHHAADAEHAYPFDIEVYERA